MAVQQAVDKKAVAEIKKNYANALCSYHTEPESLMQSDKPFRYIMDNTGVKRVIQNKVGFFVAKTDTVAGLPEYQEGVQLTVPLIPRNLFDTTLAFFRKVMERKSNAEAMVQFYYDEERNVYILECPEQSVSGASVHFQRNHEKDEKYILVMDIHSHNTMGAFFSGTDNADEKETRCFGVIGNITPVSYKALFRVSVGGVHKEVSIDDIFRPARPDEPVLTFPDEWLERCKHTVAQPVQGGAYYSGYHGHSYRGSTFQATSYRTGRVWDSKQGRYVDPPGKRWDEQLNRMVDIGTPEDSLKGSNTVVTRYDPNTRTFIAITDSGETFTTDERTNNFLNSANTSRNGEDTITNTNGGTVELGGQSANSTTTFTPSEVTTIDKTVEEKMLAAAQIDYSSATLQEQQASATEALQEAITSRHTTATVVADDEYDRVSEEIEQMDKDACTISYSSEDLTCMSIIDRHNLFVDIANDFVEEFIAALCEESLINDFMDDLYTHSFKHLK